jgi:hypothetical protein
VELELQAADMDPNDPADAPGYAALLAASYNTIPSATDEFAQWWSAEDRRHHRPR